MSLFDIIKKMTTQGSAFGGGAAAHAPGHETAAAHPAMHAPSYASSGSGRPGAYSPAADTVVDERDMYHANKAGFDAKWAGSPLLAKALARHKGVPFDEAPTEPEPELGAPKTTRPLASPEDVIASVTAAPKPAAAPEAAGAGGSFWKENYDARRAAMDSRAENDDWYQKAMARYARKK